MKRLNENSGYGKAQKKGTTRRDFLKESGLGVLAANLPMTPIVAAPARDHAEVETASSAALFSPAAQWIWDGADRWSYHHYIQARKTFRVTLDERERVNAGACAALAITADAYYQARLNGRVIGAGPAKSAEGRRSVDSWDIASFLRAGENELEVVALSVGVGTMTYCAAEAGLIFELDLAGRKIPSDTATEVRSDPARQRLTARRKSVV